MRTSCFRHLRRERAQPQVRELHHAVERGRRVRHGEEEDAHDRAYGRGLPACQYVPRRVAPPILVDGLRKSYGAQLALGGVSFEVAAGEIVGLLGPNGAGKSTTLGILATLLRFDAGRVAVAGHALPVGAAPARRALGLVPQQVAVYPTLGARENLRFFARGFGLGRREAARLADATLDLVGLAAGAGLTPVLHLRTARPLPPGWLAGIAGAALADSSAPETTVKVTDTATVPAILAAAFRVGGDVLEMALVRPSLADAFFALTGRALRDEDTPAAASA